ncbi:hypothetical protein E2C01_099254 [Portunus trituberculatus]|uniref:Uncharacterized protein n=1 Tax=Portunus trituberculatus TaxID=210409 RepID=A0A5B7JZV7_PORTR|nr:hypothetical protein [Portunus trituberculatus]
MSLFPQPSTLSAHSLLLLLGLSNLHTLFLLPTLTYSILFSAALHILNKSLIQVLHIIYTYIIIILSLIYLKVLPPYISQSPPPFLTCHFHFILTLHPALHNQHIVIRHNVHHTILSYPHVTQSRTFFNSPGCSQLLIHAPLHSKSLASQPR